MVAWTGIEHFRVGRYDPPPPADEPEDSVVCIEKIDNSSDAFIMFNYYRN